MFIWGLGIPAIIYGLMEKLKNGLDTQKAKIRYGFLYKGYKKDNFYWEIVIMYRKIISLFLVVLL
jgi:hypothetical protein